MGTEERYWWGTAGVTRPECQMVGQKGNTPQADERVITRNTSPIHSQHQNPLKGPTLELNSLSLLRAAARVLPRRVPLLPQLHQRSIAMATYTLSVSPQDKALLLFVSSFKSLLTPTVAISDSGPAPSVSQLVLQNADTVAGTNTIVSHLSTLIPVFAADRYTPLEQAEISQWLTLTAASPIAEEILRTLNDELKFKTTLLGEKISVADVVVYARIKDTVAGWSDEKRTGESGYRYLVRWLDFVQNSPEVGLNVPEGEKVKIDPSNILIYLKPEEAVKEKKKKEDEGEKKAKGRAGTAGVAEKVNEGVVEVRDVVVGGASKITPAAVAGGGKQQKKEKKEKGPRREVPPKAGPYLQLSAHKSIEDKYD